MWEKNLFEIRKSMNERDLSLSCIISIFSELESYFIYFRSKQAQALFWCLFCWKFAEYVIYFGSENVKWCKWHLWWLKDFTAKIVPIGIIIRILLENRRMIRRKSSRSIRIVNLGLLAVISRFWVAWYKIASFEWILNIISFDAN